MKVTVTQKHIDEGIVGDCKFCPIALAINVECWYIWCYGCGIGLICGFLIGYFL